MGEPIGVRPGVYTTPGQKEVMGLCIVIDDAQAGWELTKEPDGSTTISIPKKSSWQVMRTPDKDGAEASHYLQIFRVDGKLNSIVLQSFINPAGDVHTPNADHPSGKPPELRIHYTNPETTNGTEVAELKKEPAKKRK